MDALTVAQKRVVCLQVATGHHNDCCPTECPSAVLGSHDQALPHRAVHLQLATRHPLAKARWWSITGEFCIPPPTTQEAGE